MLKLATKFAPVTHAFEAAYRAGFRYAEFFLTAAIVADWQTVARVGRYYPMGYAVHFPNRLDLEDETLEHVVSLYRAVNSSCLIIHQGMHDKYRERLLDLDPDLRLAVENGSLNPDRFAGWADRNDGLALDVEHVWKHTLRDAPLPDLVGRLRDFLARHGQKVRHVHMPGYSPGLAEHRPMYSSREMVFAVLSELDAAGYEGLVVSEVAEEYQIPNDLRMDVLLFETWREQLDPLVAPALRPAALSKDGGEH